MAKKLASCKFLANVGRKIALTYDIVLQEFHNVRR